MSVLLPIRGSGILEAGVVYEVQKFPCVLYVATLVGAQQSNTETFDLPVPIVFTSNNYAEITYLYIRVNATVSAAIKKDPFSPMKR